MVQMILENCWEMPASIARAILCDQYIDSNEQGLKSSSPIFPSSLATVVICSRSCPKGTKSATLYSLPRHRKKSCLQKCAGFQGKQAVLRMTVSPNAVRHREAWYIRHDVVPTPKLPKLPSPPCTHQGSTIEGSRRSIAADIGMHVSGQEDGHTAAEIKSRTQLLRSPGRTKVSSRISCATAI
jgi:hypothetical protein